MTRRAGRLVVGALTLLLAVPAAARGASSSAASVAVTPAQAKIGQTVSVAVRGFPEGHAVAVTLCGNAGRRGSVDCDLVGSVALPISKFDRNHVTPFVVGTPPVPCPCVIEATNAPLDNVAFAPITIEEFPTAAVVGNDFAQPLELKVRVRRASQGPVTWLRSFLGGPTPYKVEVELHNRSADSVEGVRLIARAGRSRSDQARRVVFPAPGTLAGGETWSRSERVTLSAPVIGGFVWTITATGNAALAKDVVNTDHQPYGLYLLLAGLVGDLGWWGYRRVRKLARRVEEAPSPSLPPSSDAESRLARPVK